MLSATYIHSRALPQVLHEAAGARHSIFVPQAPGLRSLDACRVHLVCMA